MSFTYSECVPVMQQATLMRRIKSSVASMALPYFSVLFHRRQSFGKKLSNKKCVFLYSLQRLSKFFFILRRSGRDIIINVHGSSS